MFTIYSKPGCPACDKAKALLQEQNLQYDERVLDVGQPKLPGVTYFTVDELKQRLPSARTVPIIFRQTGELIGGYDALKKHLEQ